VLGPALYRLNVSPFVVRRMVGGHVYSDPAWLAGDRLRDKRKVMDAAGARFASVAFVTGGLDRVADRAAFLDLAGRAGAPILLVYGTETPPRSRAEMEALGQLPGVETRRLARGKLAVHEEFPDDVIAVMQPFLDAAPRPSPAN
jgi:pimeloyl-ACP methyl ester carboxylesterase